MLPVSKAIKTGAKQAYKLPFEQHWMSQVPPYSNRH